NTAGATIPLPMRAPWRRSLALISSSVSSSSIRIWRGRCTVSGRSSSVSVAVPVPFVPLVEFSSAGSSSDGFPVPISCDKADSIRRQQCLPTLARVAEYGNPAPLRGALKERFGVGRRRELGADRGREFRSDEHGDGGSCAPIGAVRLVAVWAWRRRALCG